MRNILILIMVSALAILTACQSSAAPITVKNVDESPAKTETKADADHSEHSEDEAPRISLEEAKKAFDSGEAIFVDTRSESSFNNQHIKGAINIPVADFEKRYSELPKDKKIIVYCS